MDEIFINLLQTMSKQFHDAANELNNSIDLQNKQLFNLREAAFKLQELSERLRNERTPD